MGMFDTVRCRYPLPHHQDAVFQTKDLANLVLGEGGLRGTLDEYEITEDGRLMRHVHEREWREDADGGPLGGVMRSVNPDIVGSSSACVSTTDGFKRSRKWCRNLSRGREVSR